MCKVLLTTIGSGCEVTACLCQLDQKLTMCRCYRLHLVRLPGSAQGIREAPFSRSQVIGHRLTEVPAGGTSSPSLRFLGGRIDDISDCLLMDLLQRFSQIFATRSSHYTLGDFVDLKVAMGKGHVNLTGFLILLLAGVPVSGFIRRYSEFLNRRVVIYRQFGDDICTPSGR